MQFIWEENDIEPGRRIINSSGNGELIIGYRYEPNDRAPSVFTVVSLDDGLEVFHATLTTETTIQAIGGARATERVIGPGVIVGKETVEVTARTQIARWLNESGATPKTIGVRS